MKRLVGILFFSGVILLGCGQGSSKAETISKFETQMSTLCEQSNVILDEALDELDSGVDVQTISERINQPLKDLEHQIDSISKAFAPLANKAGLTNEEFESVYDNLRLKLEPMMNKYDKLQDAGVEI